MSEKSPDAIMYASPTCPTPSSDCKRGIGREGGREKARKGESGKEKEREEEAKTVCVERNKKRGGGWGSEKNPDAIMYASPTWFKN